MFYEPVFDRSDIPKKPFSRRDWVKLTLIQVDDAISHTDTNLRSGIRVARISLDNEQYDSFVDDIEQVGGFYEIARNCIKRLDYVIPESPRSENFRVAENLPDLKDKYIEDCEKLRKSTDMLFSRCEETFNKYSIHHFGDKFSQDKETIDKGVRYLTIYGLEGLFDQSEDL